MNQIDHIQNNLKKIIKHGDLYDVIAEAEGVKIHEPIKAAIKGNIFLFSRILFMGTVIVEKIKNRFAPIEKTKKMIDEIRTVLGVHVDIVRSKEIIVPDKVPKTFLSILYEEDNVYIEEYIENLKKIFNFCELYHLNSILLREKDLFENFYNINWGQYSFLLASSIFKTTLNRIVDGKYIEDECFITLNRKQLLELIKTLEITKYDKKIITDLTSYIEDVVIQNAVKEFYLYGDVDKLREKIRSRLTLIINSDNFYKEKNIGKVFENAVIEGKYIKVTKSNQKGEIISNVVESLYDYLGVSSFQDLLKYSKFGKDEEEIFRITALYLYFIETNIKKILNTSKTMTFCDKVYQSYHQKKKKKTGKVLGLSTPSDKWLYNFSSLFFSTCISVGVLTIFFITGISLDFISEHLFNVENPVITETIVKTILTPYQYSYQLEQEIVSNIVDTIRVGKQELELEFGKSRTGDALSVEGIFDKKASEEEKIAKIELTDSYFSKLLPRYYASGYAKDAQYQKGALDFDIVSEYISLSDLEDIGSFFEIKFSVTKKDLKNFLNGNEIKFPEVLYPVGMNYQISKIIITDLKDENKVVRFNAKNNNHLTDEEKEVLLSMKKPEICYGYGIGDENIFEEHLGQSNHYTNLSYEEVRKAILNGLGLEESATVDEIYNAIKRKDYSLTPIKDAQLTHKIKKMEEEEYFETISSMDSLICNLAAMLAVEVNEELTYVVGYMNADQDSYITSDERHAWAMDEAGNIIDVTPANTNIEEKQINSIIKECMDFTLRHHLPIYFIFALITVLIKKYFGKNITMYIKINKIEKVLSNADSYKTYAKIKEVLYGGCNIPTKKDLPEFIDMIDKEFASFSLEELQELKSMLQGHLKGKELHQALSLIKEVPYIKEHSEELQKVFYKVKK